MRDCNTDQQQDLQRLGVNSAPVISVSLAALVGCTNTGHKHNFVSVQIFIDT